MKTFICALIILALVVGGVFWNASYIENSLVDIRKSLSEISYSFQNDEDFSKQVSVLSNLFQSWKKKNTFISITVNKDELAEADVCFASLLAAAYTGNSDNYAVALSELDCVLSQLEDMAKINLTNIF